MDEGRHNGAQHPDGSEGDAQAIEEQCAGKIRHDDPAAAPGEPDHLDELLEIIAEEYDVRALLCHLRPRAHRYADARRRQSAGIVDAISDHGHPSPLRHQRPDALQLAVRKELRGNLIHAKTSSNVIRDASVVAAQKNGPDAHRLELTNRL